MTSEHQRKRREHVEETLRRNQAAVDAAQQTMRELRDAGDRSERVASRAKEDGVMLSEQQRQLEDARRRLRRATWHMQFAYFLPIVALLWLIFHFA